MKTDIYTEHGSQNQMKPIAKQGHKHKFKGQIMKRKKQIMLKSEKENAIL